MTARTHQDCLPALRPPAASPRAAAAELCYARGKAPEAGSADATCTPEDALTPMGWFGTPRAAWQAAERWVDDNPHNPASGEACTGADGASCFNATSSDYASSTSASWLHARASNERSSSSSSYATDGPAWCSWSLDEAMAMHDDKVAAWCTGGAHARLSQSGSMGRRGTESGYRAATTSAPPACVPGAPPPLSVPGDQDGGSAARG